MKLPYSLFTLKTPEVRSHIVDTVAIKRNFKVKLRITSRVSLLNLFKIRLDFTFKSKDSVIYEFLFILE